MSIVQDTISFTTYAERPVVTDTVKVSVLVTLSLKGEDDAQANVRETILTALRSVIDAEWAFARLDRSADRTGFEVVEAAAQIRVKEQEVNGISRRAKEISKPGLQLSVSGVDYNPTRVAIETTRKDVRGDLIRYINEEVKQYNDDFAIDEFNEGVTGGVWRICSVNFQENNSRQQRYAQASMSYAESAPMGSSGDDSSLELTQKIGLTAQVTLSRVAVDTTILNVLENIEE